MSSSKPRVLILTHRIPFPPNRGDRIRAYHLVEFLSHRAEVYLGSVSDEPWEYSQRDALESLCQSVFFARLQSPWRWLRASAGFALGKSVTQGVFYSPQQAGTDFHLAFSPEREDPGNPESDVAKIPKVVGD